MRLLYQVERTGLRRSDYAAVRRQGVFVRGSDENFNVRPKCARTPEEIGVSDLVLIALKTTANRTATRRRISTSLDRSKT